MKRTQTKPKAKRATRKPRTTLIKKDYPGGKLIEFPGIKGRVLEKVELVTSHDYHCISLCFQRKKTLHLMIDPGFTLKANFRDWIDGEGRSIKGWPPIVSAGLRLP
jgi:hypothetical protein